MLLHFLSAHFRFFFLFFFFFARSDLHIGAFHKPSSSALILSRVRAEKYRTMSVACIVRTSALVLHSKITSADRNSLLLLSLRSFLSTFVLLSVETGRFSVCVLSVFCFPLCRCAAPQGRVYRRPRGHAASKRLGPSVQQVRSDQCSWTFLCVRFTGVCNGCHGDFDRYGGGPAVNHLYVCHTCQLEIEKVEKRRKNELDMFVRVRTNTRCSVCVCVCLSPQTCPRY